MRVNTSQSIQTANMVYTRFGSWQAAKDAASFKDGKFVVRSARVPADQGTPEKR